MKFNKDTFLVPINTDTTLKIRDTIGNIILYIKVPDCTVAVFGNSVLIKQQAESKTVKLTFSNKKLSIEASILLRGALLKLKTNLQNKTNDLYYLHEQSTPSNNWIIPHNLGNTYKHVTIYDDNDVVMIGNVEAISQNGIRIQFNKPVTGKAIIS